MGHNVTLGGDRLGSGKKQKVHISGFERSTHDMSRVIRTTMAAGTLVPVMKELAKPGDTWDIDIDVQMMTHPTVGPLLGSYKVQVDAFVAPIRLYNSWLHNNKLGIGRNMAQVKLPQVELTIDPYNEDEITDWDNSQVNPSALLSYLGIRGIGRRGTGVVGNLTRSFNGVPFLAYWDIYKNYYANKQEEIGACIHTPAEAIINTVTGIDAFAPEDPSTPLNIPLLPTTGNVWMANSGYTLEIAYTGTTPKPTQIMIQTVEMGILAADDLFGEMVDTGSSLTGTFNFAKYGQITLTGWRYRIATDTNNGTPRVATFPLENIDTVREKILTTAGNVPFVISTLPETPYSWVNERVGGIPDRLSSQELLALKTYQSDLNNNWMNTEWIDGAGGINEITAVDTSTGAFKIDALILARKVYDMLNKIAISGGTYFDWQDAVHDHEPYRQCSTPMYMGGLSKELVFEEIVSNAATPEQPLGQLAGKGRLNGKHKGGNVTIKVDELSYIMIIISLTPRIDYSQGNDWDVTLDNMDQPHKPDLDGIGFQELITEQMAWWDTECNGVDWITRSAGKQPAWINYMSAVNKCFGNFAVEPGGTGGGEMYMTLNRRYERDETTGRIKDLTTYIDPSKFNNIFAETKLDAQNFWAQIGLNITTRRKMSAKIIPNL